MYCSKCGAEIMDEAVICPKCGCLTGNKTIEEIKRATSSSDSSDTFKTAAKILMIISCVFSGFAIFPLLWMLPMTMSYYNKVKNNQPVGTGFKICTLLFVNLLAGIFMLCTKD